MNILFTICARAGSVGLPDKNLKMMNGIPLVCYTLAVIKQFWDSHPEHAVYAALNTDSGLLRKIVEKQKILSDIIFVPRAELLAGDRVAKVDVIQDTYFHINVGCKFNVVVDLDITSPMRRLIDLENVLDVYQSNDAYDLVTTVVKARRSPYFNMVEEKNHGFYGKICKSGCTARQQAPQSYELNASIYAYRPSFLESGIAGTILDGRCGISVMPDFLVLDIDSEEDFEMMQFLHAYYMEKDSGLKDIYLNAKVAKEAGWTAKN